MSEKQKNIIPSPAVPDSIKKTIDSTRIMKYGIIIGLLLLFLYAIVAVVIIYFLFRTN